jgi:FG-GAP repeat
MKKTLALSALTLLALGLPLAMPAHAAGSTGTTGQAVGDFNGDGHDDLAVGAPGEDVGPEGMEIQDGGQVHVIYGSNTGLTGSGDQVFHQDTPGISDHVEEFDLFGRSVAAGDFNGDGRDDLAIGVGGEETGSEPENDDGTGAVQILFGRPGGLSTNGEQFLTQDSPGIMQVAEDGDQFGATLATGNFGRSAKDDLAISAPFEDIGNPSMSNAGLVHVLYGSNTGPSAQGDQIWHQDTPGVKGVAGEEEYFGFALAAANFGRNGRDDLAIGVWGDTLGNMNALSNVGAVNVLYGSPDGLAEQGNQRWTQGSDGIKDVSESGDGFGWGLSAGNLGKSRFADLAVGAPFEDVGDPTVSGAGAVNVIYGREGGLRAKGNQFWTKMTPGIGGSLESGANFGNTPSVGDFGKSRTADLAVGAPFQDVPGANSQEGEVTVIYGTRGGLKAEGSQTWSQDTPGIKDAAVDNEYFGGSAAAGDFGKSNRKDLSVGVPGEDTLAGAVNVLYGKQSGLSAQGDQFWQQGLDGINGVAEVADQFAVGRDD